MHLTGFSCSICSLLPTDEASFDRPLPWLFPSGAVGFFGYLADACSILAYDAVDYYS